MSEKKPTQRWSAFDSIAREIEHSRIADCRRIIREMPGGFASTYRRARLEAWKVALVAIKAAY